jgi:hypothetical protein
MSLTTTILALARCRTRDDRIRCLQGAVHDKQFNIDQQSELRQLLDEARKAPGEWERALRPVLNPADVCDNLVALKDGAKPVLSTENEAVIEEWLAGWVGECLLKEEQMTPPGPLLLSGPTGSGKSMLAAYLSFRLKGIRSGVIIEAHKMVDSHLGVTVQNLSKAFDAANTNSGLIVIEELDALAEARTGGGASAERENNRTTIGIMRMIELSPAAIIATTNRPDALDAGQEQRLLDRRIRWTRQNAVLAGLMDSPGRGVWRRTDDGAQTHLFAKPGVVVTVWQTDILDIYNLYAGAREKVYSSYIKTFNTYEELEAAAKDEDTPDVDLVGPVGLINRHRSKIPGMIWKINERSGDPAGNLCRVRLTTAHKAKGLEWDRVVLSDDYTPLVLERPTKGGNGVYPRLASLKETPPDEFNLVYMAITRAKVDLKINESLEEFIQFLKTAEAAA